MSGGRVGGPDEVVFLVDCDNTLIDNDGVEHDLADCLAREVGPAARDRYWAMLDALRHELGYTDYLAAIQRLRLELADDNRLFSIPAFLLDYPFASRLYPGALAALSHLRRWGLTVILSDGDAVLQPRKLQRSGLWAAVEGRVLITVHKELVLDRVAARYPARHHVMVDDKLRLLTAIKASWRDRVTTVFPRQGHYAHDPAITGTYPAADLRLESIGELVTLDLPALLGAARRRKEQS